MSFMVCCRSLEVLPRRILNKCGKVLKREGFIRLVNQLFIAKEAPFNSQTFSIFGIDPMQSDRSIRV